MEGTIDRSLAVDIGVKAVQMGQKEFRRVKFQCSSPRLKSNHLTLLSERRSKMPTSRRNLRFQGVENVFNRFCECQTLFSWRSDRDVSGTACVLVEG